MNSMNKIVSFSLTVASIVLLSSPTHAFPLRQLAGGAAKHGDEAAGVAKYGDNVDDAVRGVPQEVAPATAGDTPLQMLETGAADAGLDSNGAVKGADQLPAEPNDWQMSEAAPAAPVAAGAGAVAGQEGPGSALPFAGGATLALGLGYGLYRAVKSRG